MTDDDVTRKLKQAGDALGLQSIQWGRRHRQPRPFALTTRDLRLLAFLHDFNYATTSTLAVLFWGRYTSAVRGRLKLLHDAELIDKLRPHVPGHQGSHEWIYRLTQRGWQILLDAQLTADGHPYRPAQLTSIAYAEHDVQVAALIAHLSALSARRHGHPIAAAGGAFQALGPRAGRIDRRHETAPPAISPAARLNDRRFAPGHAIRGVLAPDATLLGCTADGERTAVLIEYDRTGKATKQIARLRRYDYFLTLGWRQTRYAALDLEPLLLVVCPTEQHTTRFVEIADDELTASLHTPDGTASHPGRELTAFTSRNRLLASDWRVTQVPSHRGGHHSRREPVDQMLALDQLFAPQPVRHAA